MRYIVSWKERKGVTDECPISETALDCVYPESFFCLVAPLCFFLITSRSFTKARLPVGVRPLDAERLREKKKSFGRQLVVHFVWSRWSRKRRRVNNEVMFVLLRDEKFEHKAQVKVNPNPHFYDYFYSTVVDNMDSSSSKGCSPEINSYKCVKNWATYYFSISSIKTDLCSYICVCACVICSLWVGLLPKRARSACDYKLLNIYQNMESVAKLSGGKKIKSHLWGNGFLHRKGPVRFFFISF